VTELDGGREDRALARRPQGDGGDGSEGDRSREEGDDLWRLLDMIVHAGTTRGRGARADKTSARVHGMPGRRSPRGHGLATRPGQSHHVNLIGHSTEEVKEQRNKHSGS
jgi:hypothetical protein